MSARSRSLSAPREPVSESRSDVNDGLDAVRAQRDAHIESIIPRQFLWGIDALTMCAAFGLTILLAPSAQGLVAPGGLLHAEWLNWLELPGSRLGRFSSGIGAAAVLSVTVPVTLAVIEMLRGYRHIERLSRTRLLVPAWVGPILGLSAFTLVAFGLRIDDAWSRVFLFGYLVLSITMLSGYRMALWTYKRRRFAAGRYARAVGFVGCRADVRRVLAGVREQDLGTLYHPAGIFALDHDKSAGGRPLPDLGTVDQVASVLVQTPIDLMVIVLPNDGAPWLKDVVQACDYLRVAVQIVPQDLIGIAPSLQDLRSVDGPLGAPGVLLQPWDMDRGALFVKRVLDVLVAAALLVLLSPLFVLIAIAIKLSTPGARIFHRWQVIGYNGRPFTGYKFTTMVVDAESRRAELMHLNEMSGPVFKIKNDPRVTRLGRVLRKFSLNELPQLWSVVKGDMSLVGPRPAGDWEIGQYEAWHKRRLSFRPGITCLWQVRGRNKISRFDDWVKMDLEYIDHWSLWLDVKILFRTLGAVVGGSGS